jgi:hypothetical protein
MWEYMKFWVARQLAELLVGVLWMGIALLVIGAFWWLVSRR